MMQPKRPQHVDQNWRLEDYQPTGGKCSLCRAAPDMLEALKGARATLARLGHDTAHLEVVIAKAEGR